METSTTLTSEEQKTLIEFRKNIEDVLGPDHDNNFLLRWLRAKDFKLKDAEAMLRKSLDWRRKYKIDSLPERYQPPEVLQKYWPVGFCGYDKEGCPILLLRFGNIDMRGVIYSAKKSDICNYCIKLFCICEAKMKEQTSKLGKLVDKLVIISDNDNFAFYQIAWGPAFQLLATLVQIYEDNYPERLKHVLAINTPAIFHIALALLKPFFSEKTFQKFNLMRRGAWKSTLLKEIDENQLPAYMGGKIIGPNGDIYCTNLVSAGGKIPTSFYSREKSLTNEKQAKTIQIRAASTYSVDIFVPQPESVLNWEFRTHTHSIGFGLFQKHKADLNEIIPIEKVNCDIFPESGSLYCKEKGTYVLKFDNSFSWTRSKTITFFTAVIPTKKELQ